MTEPCKHSCVFGHTCAECGSWVDLEGYKQMSNGVWMRHEEAEQATMSKEEELRKIKKLALIVDLDKTLIDTASKYRGNMTEEEANKLIDEDREHAGDFLQFVVGIRYLVRIRPYVREFLQKIAPLYDMQLYTLSQRSYATEIVKFLDPDGKFFHGRILCRDDDAVRKFGIDRKCVSAFFPGSDKMVVVLDDSPQVWSQKGMPHWNLVQLAPFQYFMFVDREPMHVFPRGIADTALVRIGDVLVDIHRRFYDETDGTSHVMVALTDIKSSVLCDCYIYFDEMLQNDILTSRAEEFGATVISELLPYCTHVITLSGKTRAVAEAMEYSGIHIVSFEWFDLCCLGFQRLDEANPQYRVPGAVAVTNGPRERTDPPHWSDARDSDLSGLFSESGEEEEDDCEDVDISFLYTDKD